MMKGINTMAWSGYLWASEYLRTEADGPINRMNLGTYVMLLAILVVDLNLLPEAHPQGVDAAFSKCDTKKLLSWT